jgi:hypothetical protein
MMMKAFLAGFGAGLVVGLLYTLFSREPQGEQRSTRTRASVRQFKDSEDPVSGRDPEERPVQTPEQVREKMLDKTLADSFPTSDPPSSIPDPSSDSLAS